MILRAAERLDPRAAYGRPWTELQYHEQMEFLGFSSLRNMEDRRG